MISRRGSLKGAAALATTAILPGTMAQAFGVSGSAVRSNLAPALGKYHALLIALGANNAHDFSPTARPLGAQQSVSERIFGHSPTIVSAANQAGFYSGRYENILRATASRIDQRYTGLPVKMAAMEKAIADQRAMLKSLRGELEQRVATALATNGADDGSISEGRVMARVRANMRFDARCHEVSDRIESLLDQQETLRRTAYASAEQPLVDALVEARTARALGRLPRAVVAQSAAVSPPTKAHAFAYLAKQFDKAGDALLAHAS